MIVLLSKTFTPTPVSNRCLRPDRSFTPAYPHFLTDGLFAGVSSRGTVADWTLTEGDVSSAGMGVTTSQNAKGTKSHPGPPSPSVSVHRAPVLPDREPAAALALGKGRTAAKRGGLGLLRTRDPRPVNTGLPDIERSGMTGGLFAGVSR